jgi:hypothetical protein
MHIVGLELLGRKVVRRREHRLAPPRLDSRRGAALPILVDPRRPLVARRGLDLPPARAAGRTADELTRVQVKLLRVKVV